MTEEKQFIRWMAFVTFLIFGVAKGIPAALTLAIPEPLPPLAPLTQAYAYIGWETGMRPQTIEMQISEMQFGAELAELASSPANKCGRHQYDIDFAGRIIRD